MPCHHFQTGWPQCCWDPSLLGKLLLCVPCLQNLPTGNTLLSFNHLDAGCIIYCCIQRDLHRHSPHRWRVEGMESIVRLGRTQSKVFHLLTRLLPGDYSTIRPRSFPTDTQSCKTTMATTTTTTNNFRTEVSVEGWFCYWFYIYWIQKLWKISLRIRSQVLIFSCTTESFPYTSVFLISEASPPHKQFRNCNWTKMKPEVSPTAVTQSSSLLMSVHILKVPRWRGRFSSVTGSQPRVFF